MTDPIPTSIPVPAMPFSDEDSRKIRNALGRLPYSADTRLAGKIPPRWDYSKPDAITADQLVEFLEEFTRILNAHAEQDRENEEELRIMRSDVRGFRRLVGIVDA